MSRRADALIIAIGVLLFCAPMFAEPLGIASGDAWRDNDWLNNRSFDLMSRQAILDHGQFPLRAPGVGGGFPILGHPSDGSWAPTLLPVLLFGDVLGVKVNLIALLLLGCWGVLGLARDWLGLPRGPALFAVGAFAFSGWFPSMMLVGFYPQALLLLTPVILRLLLSPRPAATLLAGFALFAVLQQGGNALPVLVLFAAAFAVLAGWRRREVGELLGRLGLALLIAAALGVGKLVPLVDLIEQGTYAHAEPPRLESGGPPVDADFFPDLPSLLSGLMTRAPTVGRYAPYPDFGVPLQARPGEGLALSEFTHVGLTPTILLLALLGVARGRGLAVLGGWFLLICLGPHFVVDLHRLGPGSLPVLRGLSQPIKYYSFFFVLPACLLSGVGFGWLVEKASGRLPKAALMGLGLLLLVPPFASNRGAWGERFALPVEAERGPFEQVAQLGHPSWAERSPAEIEQLRARTLLREFARPPGASEYPNLLAGRGTIDWYGTLRLPEPSVPARWVLPDGSELPNPAYRGEAWVEGADPGSAAGPRVLDLQVTPNFVRVRVEGPGRLVVNQRALPGFVVEGASAAPGELLSAELVAGPQEVVFAYRPRGTRLALLGSALALLLWAVALLRLSRPRASGSG